MQVKNIGQQWAKWRLYERKIRKGCNHSLVVKLIGRLHNNLFAAEAYAARPTSDECIYWKTIVVELGLRYRFERFTVLTDSKSINFTVDAPKLNKEVNLPQKEIAMVHSKIQFEGIKFPFVPTQMMIADCLTMAMSGRDLLGVLEDRMRLTSKYSITAVSLYAPGTYLDKELDENYEYGDL